MCRCCSPSAADVCVKGILLVMWISAVAVWFSGDFFRAHESLLDDPLKYALGGMILLFLIALRNSFFLGRETYEHLPDGEGGFTSQLRNAEWTHCGLFQWYLGAIILFAIPAVAIVMKTNTYRAD